MDKNQESANNHDERSELENFRGELNKLSQNIESLISKNGEMNGDLNQAIEKSNELIDAANTFKDGLTKAKKKKKELEKIEGQFGMKEFVQKSLLDIMQGVDNAATKAKCEATKNGLQAEGFLSSVSMIGAPSSGEPQTATVEFDLVVTAAKETDSSENKSSGVGFSLNVVSMMFGLRAEHNNQSETSQHNSSSWANRIRFSVPITYASQRDPLDEE